MATENIYRKLSVTDLSAIILKGGSVNADGDGDLSSRGSSEAGDDLSMDHSRMEPHSPTDASEDSVEVKVTPITLVRNKRKSTEPSKVIFEQETGPIKKRIRYTTAESNAETDGQNHFRPWDHREMIASHETMPNPAEVLVRHPGVTTLHRPPPDDRDTIQEQPLALVAKKSSNFSLERCMSSNSLASCSQSEADVIRNHPKSSDDLDIPLTVPGSVNDILTSVGASSASTSSSCSQGQRPQQRNYKNMTRERRIEANARERTRVHTISAAYDTLRKAIPSYSNTQKLSKLSVLRVACSYILSLSRMAGQDYSEDQSSPSIAECLEYVTRTIQTEGKLRKKRDE